MARIKYVILKNPVNPDAAELLYNGLVAYYSTPERTIVARYLVNKTPLRKILEESMGEK